MKIILFILLILFCHQSYCQKETNLDNNRISEFCEDEAHFPGGQKKLVEFIKSNLVYPKDAIEKNITGIVYVGFTVNEDGAISNIKIEKGVFPSIDKEVIRILKEMPIWDSAYFSGMGNLKERVRLPIKFELLD